jgi:phosphoribosylpyrophosphate synthetase
VIPSAEQPGSLHLPTAVLLGSFSLEAPDQLHDLVRSARSGSPEAALEVRSRVRSAIRVVWPDITDATLVPVPRHVPGSAHSLVVAICDEIARARNWLIAGDALRRIEPAPEGKAGGERDVESEATTVTWTRSRPGGVVVLVDDVIRTGATLQACVRAVRASGDGRTLLAVALAQAEIPGRARVVELAVRS